MVSERLNQDHVDRYFAATDQKSNDKPVVVKITSDLKAGLQEYGILKMLNQKSEPNAHGNSFLKLLCGGEFENNK